MKIGVLSDSHGYRTNIVKAIDQLIHMHRVDLVVHLGDDFEDSSELERYDIRVMRVPGVYSSYYRDPQIPNRLLSELEGWKVLLTHTITSHQNDLPTDPAPECIVKEGRVDLILFGHSHIPTLEEKEGVIQVNPGHLRDADKKGYPPTFGIVEMNGDHLNVSIIDLATGRCLESRSFTRHSH